MKLVFILTLLMALLAGCKGGDKGDQGETGATGPAGQDAIKEWFITTWQAGETASASLERPIKLTIGDKVLEWKVSECVKLTESQIKMLVISLPEVPASPPPVAKSKQPAVAVCDNTNDSKEDDCALYQVTWLDLHNNVKPTTGASGSATPNWELRIVGFPGGLNTVQQAKCKAI